MNETAPPKRDPKALAFADAILILAPLLLFLFIVAISGAYDSIHQKAEWSFVMVFFLVEALRDQVKRQRLENYHEDHTEAGVVFYGLILTIGALFLFADFRNSIDPSAINLQSFYTIKFSLFTFSFILFLYHRYKKYSYLPAKAEQ
jgi:cytochrome b561